MRGDLLSLFAAPAVHCSFRKKKKEMLKPHGMRALNIPEKEQMKVDTFHSDSRDLLFLDGQLKTCLSFVIPSLAFICCLIIFL